MTDQPQQPPEPVEQQAESSARRRRLGIVAVLLAGAAVAMWAASRMTWATLLGADGMSPPRTFTVKGADWSPWLTPLAIVLAAAIAVAVALKGWALRVVAVIVAVIGVVSVIPALSLLTSSDNSTYAARAIDVPGRYQVLQITTHAWAAIVVIIGTVLAILAAVALLRVTRTNSVMSSKYLSPGARRAELEREVFAQRSDSVTGNGGRIGGDAGAADTSPGVAGTRSPADDPAQRDHGAGAPVNERLLWDALDTGEDPTASGSADSPDR